MAKKRNSTGKTAARMVMDVFLRREALTPETAITIDEFKDLRLTTAVISYTIGNLMNDGVVQKVEGERYYFVQENWRKLEKKVGRAYWILLGSPLIVLIIFLLVKNWNDLSKIFFK